MIHTVILNLQIFPPVFHIYKLQIIQLLLHIYNLQIFQLLYWIYVINKYSNSYSIYITYKYSNCYSICYTYKYSNYFSIYWIYVIIPCLLSLWSISNTVYTIFCSFFCGTGLIIYLPQQLPSKQTNKNNNHSTFNIHSYYIFLSLSIYIATYSTISKAFGPVYPYYFISLPSETEISYIFLLYIYICFLLNSQLFNI